MTFMKLKRSFFFFAITGLLLTSCADMKQSPQYNVLKEDKEYKTIRYTNKSESLVKKAKMAVNEGNFDLAETSLERAIRKEPYNGWLWFELASVNYARGDYGQTLQLCKKSLSLAQSDKILQNENQQLMKQANKKE